MSEKRLPIVGASAEKLTAVKKVKSMTPVKDRRKEVIKYKTSLAANTPYA